MQGLVTLDFGNSRPHAGLFSKTGGKWELLKVVPWVQLTQELDQLNFTPDNSQLVLAEVRPREEELIPLLQKGFLLTRVKDYWRGKRFAGMPVDYADTLGEDRLILAHHLYKTDKTPTLIIDAGTFVTMDVINAEGFQGGHILPGQEAYFSVFARGEQLKHIKLLPGPITGLPRDTITAMSGGYYAFVALAKEIISIQKIQKLVITGGKMDLWLTFFEELKGSMAVHAGPHLLHLALQHWMTTQIEPL